LSISNQKPSPEDILGTTGTEAMKSGGPSSTFETLQVAESIQGKASS